MLRRFLIPLVILLLSGLLIFLIARQGDVWTLARDRAVQSLILGGWGMLVAVGILRSGLRFAAFTRDLALWLAVLVIFVAGYQYRYELQDVASRISAGIVPGSPLSTADANGRVTVELQRTPGGHFEARGTVNGVAVRFLVDTGATSVVLSAEDAARAGYDLSALAFNIPVSTANGEARAAGGTAASLRLGAISRERLAVLIAAPGQLEQSLLGMNFIGSLSGFDMRGDRMILRD